MRTLFWISIRAAISAALQLSTPANVQTFRAFRMNKSQPSVRSWESRAACDDFWLKASESSFESVWDNREDDVYAELERRDAEGYLKHPQQLDEIDEWQSEQDWGEP